MAVILLNHYLWPSPLARTRWPVVWHRNCTALELKRCNMQISRHSIATLLVGLFIGALAGCADHPSEVPADGVKVAEGNQKLLYKAPEAGTIFIYESPDNRLIYRSPVRRGDTVELNTNDDRISINGKTVMEKGLGRGRDYKMFFDPTGSRKVVVERRTETISR